MPATITVKNIPADLYARLKQSASRNRRSINSEVIALIEKTLTPQKINLQEFLVSARALREKTQRYNLTQDFIDRTKREGRP